MDTHIIEKISELVANGQLDAEYLNVESEHSAMAACIGAQATGVRTFTASAGQGVALMWELLYVASGMRLPIVMAVANRALSSPLNIWGDWSDSMGCRDTGWIQLYCKDAQEALDTTIQAYKIAETVSLPVMVCIDGFFLSHTMEPVDVPESVSGFLDDYKPHVSLDPANPISQGTYAMPDTYQEFKESQEVAIQSALSVIKKTNDEFEKKFGRGYGDGLIETYNMDKADYAIITMGTVAGTVKHVLEKEKTKDVGLIRLRSFRPFPTEALQRVIGDIKSLGVLEKDVSLGKGGALWTDVKSVTDKPTSNFIGGLGGRDITMDNIKEVINTIKKSDTNIHWIGSRLKK